MTTSKPKDRCPCGGIILADTEDWETPLCYECWVTDDKPFFTAEDFTNLVREAIDLQWYALGPKAIAEKSNAKVAPAFERFYEKTIFYTAENARLANRNRALQYTVDQGARDCAEIHRLRDAINAVANHWCGMDHEHVGGDLKFLQEQVLYVRKYLQDVLEGKCPA